MKKQEEIREMLVREYDYLYRLKPDKDELTRKAFIECCVESLLKYLHSQGVVIKDRSCGVSHQQGVWKKMFSVRSIIDGEVELFDGYGTKEDKNGDNEVP